MTKPTKKLITGLFMAAMVFMTLPVMASTQNSETNAVPLDTTWILAIAGIALGMYKIYVLQKTTMGTKSA